MFLTVFKRFGIVILIFAFALHAGAQQTHFVYLQTENGQPFYIKINNNVVSSSPAGYLILPKLTDGDYNVSIGFPKREFPEEKFQMLVDKKNQGFLLKNFGEKGWGLFNLQSYVVIMGASTNITATSSKNLQDDPFSKLLANVVKDSSILQKNEPIKKEEVAVAPKVDTTAVVVEKTGSVALSLPTRFLRKKNKDGLEMVYIDHDENLSDTVRIFIPFKNGVIKPHTTIDTPTVQSPGPSTLPAADTNLVAAQPAPQMKPDTVLSVSPEKKNVVENRDSAMAKKDDEVKQPEINSKDSVIQTRNPAEVAKKDDVVVLPRVVQSSSTNSDCKSFAANEDFLKLRKKMASENSEDNMMRIAKKVFHSKCFSTEQIKNLSFLFLTNAGKYMFFDLAYPFASDSDQYNTLESQLTDSYYTNRFKAMIHK